jgi:hypothetical protein
MSNQDKSYVALDLHKSYIVGGAVDDQGQVVLNPRRVPSAKFEEWAKKHLRPTDAVVLEAGSSTWLIPTTLS